MDKVDTAIPTCMQRVALVTQISIKRTGLAIQVCMEIASLAILICMESSDPAIQSCMDMVILAICKFVWKGLTWLFQPV